jgi:hypothetical protein
MVNYQFSFLKLGPATDASDFRTLLDQVLSIEPWKL